MVLREGGTTHASRCWKKLLFCFYNISHLRPFGLSKPIDCTVENTSEEGLVRTRKDAVREEGDHGWVGREQQLW